MSEKTYAVMFTPPGENDQGTPEGPSLLRALAGQEVQEDGYGYAALGEETRANLNKAANSLELLRGCADYLREKAPELWEDAIRHSLSSFVNLPGRGHPHAGEGG